MYFKSHSFLIICSGFYFFNLFIQEICYALLLCFFILYFYIYNFGIIVSLCNEYVIQKLILSLFWIQSSPTSFSLICIRVLSRKAKFCDLPERLVFSSEQKNSIYCILDENCWGSFKAVHYSVLNCIIMRLK